MRFFPTCPTGVVEVRAPEEMLALRGCERLAGLVIRTGTSLSFAPLATLTAITGDLLVGPTLSVDAVDLPNLVSVGGAVRIAGNSSLAGVFLPKLRSAARVELLHNASLASASLPALVETTHLALQDNAELEALTASALERVGTLLFTSSPRLGLLLLPRLARVDDWQVGPLPAMTPDELEALRVRATSAPAPSTE